MRYQKKLSGPIIDRIDLWVDVPPVLHQKLSDDTKSGERSESVKKRVEKARKIQRERFALSKKKISLNAEMGAKEIGTYVPISPEIKTLLNKSAEKLELSARAYHKVIKLARTIADLEGSGNVEAPHILEALQYRPREK